MNTLGMKSVLVCLCATALTFAAHATAYTWTGGADDGGKWSSPGNWGVESGYPGSAGNADTVTIPSGTISINGEGGTYNLANLTLTKGTNKAQNSVTLKDATFVFSTTSPGNIPEYVNLTFENVSWTALNNSWFQVPSYGEALFLGTTVINLNNANKGLYNQNKADPRIVFKDGTATLCGVILGSDKNGTNRNLFEVDNAVVTCTGTFKYGNESIYGVKPTLKLYNGGRIVASSSFTASSAFTVDAVLPATGADTPRISVSGSPSLNFPITFKIDASACAVGIYPIVKATGKVAITLPSGGFNDYVFDIKAGDGFKATAGITDDNKTIYVEVMNAGTEDNSWVTPPAVTPSEWFTDDEEKGVFTPAVPAYGEVVSTLDGEAVAQTEMQAALDALTVGSHTLAFSVERKEGSWTELATNLTVTVKRHSNAWTVEPELTPTTWWAGSAVTFQTNAYAAVYGTVTCSHTFEELAALPAGRYDVTFTVEATEAIEGLVKVIPVIVRGEDTKAAIYTWKSDVLEGNWCDPNNWTTDVGTLGYPSNELVFAVIPTGTQRRAIDLQGCMIPLSKSSTPDGKTGLTISGAGATIRNGGVSLSRLWGGENNVTIYEDMTIDLNSSVKTSYFSLQKLATFTLRGDVSVMNGQLLAQAYNDDLTICDGETYVDGHFMFGNNDTKSGYRSTKGTLAITNATLKVNYDCTFGTSGRTDHVPPVLKLFDGNIVCTNTYKQSGAYLYGKFNMTSTARVDLMLSPADKAVPRIVANYANLSNMTFVVKSAETGKYPLVSVKNSLSLPGDSLDGLSIDVSALGKNYIGRLMLGADGKTLYAKVAQRGFTLVVQ